MKDSKVIKYCQQCGKIFTVQSYRKETAIFCSRSCHAKRRRPELQRREKRVCKWCKKSFFVIPCSSNVYCSRECFNQMRGSGIYKTIGKRECLNCGKIFTPRETRNKFCTAACYHEWDIRKVPWNKGKRYCYSIDTLRKIKEARKKQKFPTTKTKPELIFIKLCEKHKLPFKYTGDGAFWVGNLNPDFIESNGRKLAVEVFSDYWHSPLLRPNLLYSQTYHGRKEILKKMGWKVVILWECELKSKNVDNIIIDKFKEYVT